MAVQHPRQRRAAHAGGARLRHGAEGRPAGALYRRPQARQRCARIASRRSPRCAPTTISSATSQRSAKRNARCGSIPPICPEAIARLVAENGGKIVRGSDPIAPMKAVKNAAEIAGARAAQQRDGAAVTRFLAWFDREAPRGADRDRRGRGAGELSPRHRAAEGRFVSDHRRRRRRTAPSCITASPARATAASRRANCS